MIHTTPSPATRQEKLEAIRAKCVEANPDKVTTTQLQGVESRRTFTVEDDTIRLADVLQAMRGDTQGTGNISIALNEIGHWWKPILVEVEGNYRVYHEWVGGDKSRWNLRDDDLSRQSDECIDFLHSLLA